MGYEELGTKLAAQLPPWLSVRVKVGPVQSALPDSTTNNRLLSTSASEAMYVAPTGTRLHMTTDQITVDPAAGDTLADLQYLVYSAGVRNVLNLRGRFSLHASAFLRDGVAVALIGAHRAGKSTLLLEMSRRGYEPIVDDLLVVANTPNGLKCAGWRRPVHARPETVAALDLTDGSRINPRLRADTPLLVELTERDHHDVQLNSAIALTRHDGVGLSVAPLVGAAKLQFIRRTGDRFRQASGSGRAAAYFRWATTLAENLPITEVSRPNKAWTLAQVADTVERVLAQTNQSLEGSQL